MRAAARVYVRKPRTKAMATVELALVLPLLTLLLFGIIEFGLLFKDSLVLQQAGREGVRAAAIGATPAQVDVVVMAAAPTLKAENMTITKEYRLWTGTTWSGWMALGTALDGSTNDAPPNSQVRVSIVYAHPLVTGGLFSWMATDEQNNTVTLRAVGVSRRE